MDELDQLQKEWLVINASKQMLALVKGHDNVTYSDAIKLAKQNALELFKDSKTGLVKKTKIERIRDDFELMAKLKSVKLNRPITAFELLDLEIDELLSLEEVTTNPQELARLDRKRNELIQVYHNQPNDDVLTFERVTENQAIMKDAFRLKGNREFVNSHLGKFNEYHDRYNKNVFRITILHPNPSEAIVGADLIYEQYNDSRNKVRIAAIQYKIWEKGVLYFSSASNLVEQLAKMENCICGNQFCRKKINNDSDSYRFPFCAAFLKPTDKLQSPTKLHTSGHLLPVCKIDKVKTKARNDYKIELEDVLYFSITSDVFEELFNNGKIGSDWMDVGELENFYRISKILEPNQNIILYAQSVK